MMKKLYCVISGKYRKLEKPKIPYILEKHFFLSFVVNVHMKMKIFLKKNQLRYENSWFN